MLFSIHCIFLSFIFSFLNSYILCSSSTLEQFSPIKNKVSQISPQFISIEINTLKLNAPLIDPMTSHQKFPNGNLKSLQFQGEDYFYKINFYHLLHEERVSSITRFILTDNNLYLLNGKTETFDIIGRLLSSTNWSKDQLHGKQVSYNYSFSSPHIIEHKKYEKNIPVGTWYLFYSNGNIASEIIFPNSIKEWNSSFSGGKKQSIDLLEMDFPNPLTIIQKWFYRTGNLQEKREYSMYKQENIIYILDHIFLSSYNNNKELMEVKDILTGTGKEVDINSSNIKSTFWFNDLIFKQNISEKNN